jgi:hypothetical protein
MEPLSAEILTEQVIGDERAAFRRTLRLGVSAYSSGDVATALILNISETGLLIETVVKLAVGETLQVDIPEASASTVRVVWTEKLLVGCEFVNPVSTGVVSAAQLKSPIEAACSIYELPAADADFPDESEHWDPDEASIQTAIVIVTSVIAVLALIIFLAAILLH